ncbi:MAG: hypothetical protein PVH64_07390 [Bacillota bacterium]|jgi:hypothetical protein
MIMKFSLVIPTFNNKRAFEMVFKMTGSIPPSLSSGIFPTAVV